MTAKACTRCKTSKLLTEYHFSAKAADKAASWCKVCTNTYSRGARKRNYSSENKRRWQLKTRYGITPAQVEAMKLKQESKCAVCSKTLCKFHIDHDHNTRQVRGLLCHGCNVKLGGWDDIQWRASALRYLGITS